MIRKEVNQFNHPLNLNLLELFNVLNQFENHHDKKFNHLCDHHQFEMRTRTIRTPFTLDRCELLEPCESTRLEEYIGSRS